MKNSTKSYTISNTLAILYLLLMFLVVFALAILAGSTRVTLPEAFNALMNLDDGSTLSRIFLHVRIPRALTALMCGAALAISGALLQTALLNPLAAPNIIGVNSGAGLGVIVLLAFFPQLANYMPLAAFIGALAAVAIVYLIASLAKASRLTLILSGIAVSSFFGAITDAIMTISPSTQSARISFLIGGFSGATMSQVSSCAPIIVLGIVLAIILSFDLSALSLGDELACSLGIRVKLVRFLALLAAAMLAGGAVSLSGLLGFVGIIAPHIVRTFIGHNVRVLIPLSGILGATLTLLCDLISRVFFAPYELPVGILLAFIGAPFFICLLIGEKRHAKS